MGSSSFTIFGAAFLALLAAGYWAQTSLPPPKPKVVGIDLGTTYSCIAGYSGGNDSVKVYQDSAGHKCIPSVVSFDNGNVLVGYAAMAKSEVNPRNTIYDAKRFIGKTFTEEEFSLERSRYPFQMDLSDRGRVSFVVQSRGEDLRVSPEMIGSYIISTLRATARSGMGLDAPAVTLAIMSVPAEFDEAQRNATRTAGALAGLKVLRVINEPTAAALAYGLHKSADTNTVMVIDLGGGTLDVSLLSIQGGMFFTMAMAGNNHLGGQDFNERLMDHVLSAYGCPHTLSPEDMQTLRREVELAKLDLSASSQALVSTSQVTCPHAAPASPVQIVVSREEFESLISDLMDRVLEPVHRVLTATDTAPHEVDEVVLVGGSTRVPRVRAVVEEFFGGRAPNTRVDPELAVVSGTAVQGGVVQNSWPVLVSAIEVPSAVKKIHL